MGVATIRQTERPTQAYQQGQQALIWDQQLINKYDRNGPRYTSYPTALEFQPGANQQHLEQLLQNSKRQQLSLYIHIPFCHKLCYYCGCNKIVTRHQHKADQYLDYLATEISAKSAFFRNYKVTQFHLGGGTPTFLNQAQMQRLINMCRDAFNFADTPEMSIEIDPREIELLALNHLVANGFNRISIGVQDFDQHVQIAVNRVQDEQHIRALVKHARDLGIQSINLDLIYGLPWQKLDSFKHTLTKVIALDADRISVFNYAHMPTKFAAQRKIPQSALPSANQKLALLETTAKQLCDAGYQYIGMDHFAKSDDQLAKLQRQGNLHRNFQGYTTQAENDLLGLGVSAISQLGNGFMQNHKELKRYYASIEQQQLGLDKHLKLTRDDQIRSYVIKSLICNFKLDKQVLLQKFSVEFDCYFTEVTGELADMISDGLVENTVTRLKVLTKGRPLIRQICMIFDAYLANKGQSNFSKAI